jgi:hypothetical protein
VTWNGVRQVIRGKRSPVDKPNSVFSRCREEAVISLGDLPIPFFRLRGRLNEQLFFLFRRYRNGKTGPTWSCTGWGFSCRADCSDARWSLTPPFHPCSDSRNRNGLFSVILSVPAGCGPPDPRLLPANGATQGILLSGVRTFLPPLRRRRNEERLPDRTSCF